MSNSPSFPPTNPYAPSPYTEYAPTQGRADKLPGFCLAMFIISLVFCVLRMPVVLLGVVTWIGAAKLQNPDPIVQTLPYEVLTGAAIVLFGIPANVGMLLKQRWAVVLGYLTVLASACSMVLAIWQLSFVFQAADNAPEQAGMVGGAFFSMMIRLAIVGMYVAAIMKFSKWLASRLAPSQAHPFKS